MAEDDVRVVVKNRKAWHEYHIEETLEAGLVLKGTEVKSIRAGHIQLAGAFVIISDGEAWLHGASVAPYEQGNMFNVETRRPRKLLLKKREIHKLTGRSHEQGWTLVPLSVYLKRGLVKLEVGVARGKRAYDKREALRDREANRDRERELAAWRRS